MPCIYEKACLHREGETHARKKQHRKNAKQGPSRENVSRFNTQDPNKKALRIKKEPSDRKARQSRKGNTRQIKPNKTRARIEIHTHHGMQQYYRRLGERERERGKEGEREWKRGRKRERTNLASEWRTQRRARAGRKMDK